MITVTDLNQLIIDVEIDLKDEEEEGKIQKIEIHRDKEKEKLIYSFGIIDEDFVRMPLIIIDLS